MTSLQRIVTEEALQGSAGLERRLHEALRGHALGGSSLLAAVTRLIALGAARGGAVSFSTLVDAAGRSDLGLDDPSDVDLRLAEDVASDAETLAALADFVHSHAPPESRKTVELAKRLVDVEDAYGAALLALLRMATDAATGIDAYRLRALLWEPIEARAAGGASGGNNGGTPSPLYAQPSPFDFHRVHAGAVSARLAAVHARPRQLYRRHRLYPRAPARQVVVSTVLDRLAGTSTRHVSIEAASDVDGSRSRTSADVVLATRTGSTPAECAASNVPYELEVVRVPVFGLVDSTAAASTTLTAFDTLATLVGDVWGGAQGEGDDVAGSASTSSSAPAAGASSSSEPPASALSCLAPAVGGTCLPAPSAWVTEPRTHPTSLQGLYTDYAAVSELILSPFFPDTCGLHDAAEAVQPSAAALSEAAAAAIGSMGSPIPAFGPVPLLVYEFLPGQLPLSQLLARCGRLCESQPLFRLLAADLLRALGDVEGQCLHDLDPEALTLDNVYVSEAGTRLCLRGLRWGKALPPGAPDLEARLRKRSQALLLAYAGILRQLLVAREAVDDGAGARLRVVTGRPPQRLVYREQAEVGLIMATGEAVDLELPCPNPDWFGLDEDADADASSAGGTLGGRGRSRGRSPGGGAGTSPAGRTRARTASSGSPAGTPTPPRSPSPPASTARGGAGGGASARFSLTRASGDPLASVPSGNSKAGSRPGQWVGYVDALGGSPSSSGSSASSSGEASGSGVASSLAATSGLVSAVTLSAAHVDADGSNTAAAALGLQLTAIANAPLGSGWSVPEEAGAGGAGNAGGKGGSPRRPGARGGGKSVVTATSQSRKSEASGAGSRRTGATGTTGLSGVGGGLPSGGRRAAFFVPDPTATRATLAAEVPGTYMVWLYRLPPGCSVLDGYSGAPGAEPPSRAAVAAAAVDSLVVPVTVHSSSPSPTLTAILDSCAPVLGAHPGLTVLSTLAALLGDQAGQGATSSHARFVALLRTLCRVLGLAIPAGAGNTDASLVSAMLPRLLSLMAPEPPAADGGSAEGGGGGAGPQEGVAGGRNRNSVLHPIHTVRQLLFHPYFSGSAGAGGAGGDDFTPEFLTSVAQEFAVFAWPVLNG